MKLRCTFGVSLLLAGCAANSAAPKGQAEPPRHPPTATAAPAPKTPTPSGPKAAALAKQGEEFFLKGDQEAGIRLLEEATKLAPQEATYWLKLGKAQLLFAEARGQEPPLAARQPLERCVALLPDHVLCHETLAIVLERLDEPGLALQHYFAAIRPNPSNPEYYPRPAELCVRYKLYDTALALVEAGLFRATPGNVFSYGLRVLQFQVAQARHNETAMLAAQEAAYVESGERYPETSFNLGSTYAIADKPRPKEARVLLQTFTERLCGTDQVRRHKEQCEVAHFLIQKLERTMTEADRNAVVVRIPPPPPKPSVPPPMPTEPEFPSYQQRSGEAYTVWGAGLLLRSRRHEALDKGPIPITGVIGKINLDDAPRCALHRPGIADPEDCVAPVPTFWLCDSLDARKSDCIEVQGWASNFAQIWGAIEQGRAPGSEPYIDMYWDKAIPSPIPQRGAKVTVTGRYGVTFTGASTGTSADPIMGILTYEKLKWLVPPAKNPKLPGM